MTKHLLCAIACAMAAHGATAAPLGYTLSPDDRIVTTTGPHHATAPASGKPAGYTVIFDNLASRDPLGVYMVGTGFAFGGPKNPIGYANFAAAFTPTRSATLQSLQVAAGLIEGKNEMLVSIYKDASGAPGTMLWQGSSKMPLSGDCCASASVSGLSVRLTAGKQYWLGLSAAPDGANTFASWNFNVADQVMVNQTAVDIGNGWMVSPSVPNVAFALYGN
jgi:hypothetical protein